MRQLYLKQLNSQASQTATTVRDVNAVAQYLVTGNFGRNDAFIHVYNQLGELVVEFHQISFGILPRFEIKFQHQVVASIGLSLGMLFDIIYIRELNWFIRGSLASGIYRAYYYQTKLMTVKPTTRVNGLFNELTITNLNDEPILIGIAVILDRWLVNGHPQKIKTILHQPFTVTYAEKTTYKIKFN